MSAIEWCYALLVVQARNDDDDDDDDDCIGTTFGIGNFRVWCQEDVNFSLKLSLNFSP